MTNWRERGYVPPSDGEESDSDLSTQEPIPPHYNGNLDASCSSQQITRDAVQPAATGRDDRANPAAVQSSQVTARERIQTLDLSNDRGGDDEVEEMDLDSEEGGVTIQRTEELFAPQEPRFDSPDPITGEPQPLPPITKPPRPISQRIGQPADPSCADSSPLSSPPGTPQTPPSSVHQRRSSDGVPRQRLKVVIPKEAPPTPRSSEPPVISATSPFFMHRSLRQRKAIQNNPYSLEEARYKSTLRKSGVRPIRVLTNAEESAGGNDDSQDGEYVAPPEPEEPRLRRSATRDVSPTIPAMPRRRESFPPSHQHKHTKVASADGRKRRKIGHPTKSDKRSRISSTTRDKLPASRTQTPHINGRSTQHASDIYDIPDSPSPPRPMQPPPAQQAAVPTSVRTVADRLSWLDTSEFDDDWDKDLPIMGPVTPVRMSVDSSPSSPGSHHSSPVQTEPIQIDLGGETGSSGSGEDSDGDDESQPISGAPQKVLNRFKKVGTRGILPASYLRLNASEAREGRIRHVRGPLERLPLDQRPGVARSKVSHRARASSLDLFREELGDNDDSDSSIEHVLGVVNPQKPRNSRPSTTRTRVVDLVSSDNDSDIPEDNRIDFGLSAPVRRKTTSASKPRRKKKKQTDIRDAMPSDRAPSNRRLGRTFSGSHRQAQRQRSSAPRVGIVDVVRHAKSTGASVPQFARIAARTARKRPDKGRHSPSRKLIVLETANDTAEVREVVKNWRENTLPFEPQDSETQPAQRERHQSPRRTQTRIPLPQPLADRAPPKSSGRPRARTLGSIRATQRLKQSSLNNYVTQESPIVRQPMPRRKRPSTKNYTILPGHAHFRDNTPHKFPLPVQQSRVAGRHDRPLDLADFLRASAPSRSAASQPLDDVQGQPLRTPATEGPAAAPDRLPHLPQARRLRRKQAPKRIDTELVEFRQPPLQDLQDLELLSPGVESICSTTSNSRGCLTGLLPYGSNYSLHFDIRPLKSGTMFNSETLIGKGLLRMALNTPPARILVSTPVLSASFGDIDVRWGTYDESVASDFERICETFGDAAERISQSNGTVQDDCIGGTAVRAYSFFEFVIRYISTGLNFYDPVDVTPFGQRIINSIQTCCERIAIDVSASDRILNRSDVRLALTLRAFALTTLFQILRVSEANTSVQAELDLPSSIRKVGRALVSKLLRYDFPALRRCYEDQRRHNNYERGIDQNHYAVEFWVIAIQVLDNTGIPGISFWDIVNEELHLNSIERSTDVRLFESRWQTLLTLLPLFQFDHTGVAMLYNDSPQGSVNWSLVRKLANQPLKTYNQHQDEHAGTINDYCRVIFARCHHLISKWNWDSVDQIIPDLYAFFAANGLSNLPKETDRGTPEFLTNLDRDPSLEVVDSDRCFHILLKIIGIGVRRMAKGPHKKIQSLMFRLNPNHRRGYPRDEELRMDQLVPLRNHHDLLTTLYWAAPPDSRLPIEAIRIVDPETSHHYACNIAVRAWDNLVKFQLHSGEDTQALTELMQWFDDFISKILAQHHSVRSDTQREFEAAEEKGEVIPNDWLEQTVRKKELQLEVILMDMITAIRVRLKGIPGDKKRAMILLTAAGAPAILNTSTRISSRLMLEVLDMIVQYIETCKAASPNASSIPVVLDGSYSEESQDYGGSGIFDDFELPDNVAIVPIDEVKQAAERLLNLAYNPLHRMLSNSFGADKPPKEHLLVKTVDTWTQVAAFLVHHRLKSWESFLEHSNESWSSLRNTSQTRKFTSYFLPKVIAHGGTAVYRANQATFLQLWMKVLMERESMIKYQNEFTAAVLNNDLDNPIFRNPPFSRNQSGVYVITQEQFKLRRLALISGICEDMRISFTAAPVSQRPILKRQYADLLRSLMRSMKENYEELIQSSTSGAAPTGAYLSFSHHVVSLLQQHTTEIVEIDKYFTDSSAFPLPAADPNYVISRLKKYTMNLSRPGTQKELNVFLMTQCERVAQTGEWDLLVGWLDTAICETVELQTPDQLGFRGYFCCAILPAYIDVALRYPGGWVLATPMLKVAERVAMTMRAGVDATKQESRDLAMDMLDSVLISIRRVIGRMIASADNPSSRHLTILALLLRVATASIPAAAHFIFSALRSSSSELSDQPERSISLAESISLIFRSCRYLLFTLSPTRQPGTEITKPLDILALQQPAQDHQPPPHQTHGVSAFGITIFAPGAAHAKSELQHALKERWIQSLGGDELLLSIGKERKRVVLPVPLPVREVARQRLEKVMEIAEEVAARAGMDVGFEEDGVVHASPAAFRESGSGEFGEGRRRQKARSCGRPGVCGRSKKMVDMGAVFC